MSAKLNKLDMSLVDGAISIDIYTTDGVWHKPPQALAIEVIAVGGAGGTARDGTPGEPGEVLRTNFLADELPDTMLVQVGQGGAGTPRGCDGYIIIVVFGPDDSAL